MTKNIDNKNILNAVLYSDEQPTDEQKRQLITFLENKHEAKIIFTWQKDDELKGGFRLEVKTEGDDRNQGLVYDWSLGGRLRQLEDEIRDLTALDGNIVPLIQETIRNWTPQVLEQEVGTVLTVGDGIATVSGLENATYGEILIFNGGARAMVQELKRDEICCILFGNESDITEGSIVKRTGKTAGVPVGEDFLGRVIDALGNPVDGKGQIKFNAYRPIESPAPSIIDRQPVNEPLETGILAIDSMFPIGRGQRELIIGDRQTGKTAIAIDTIINQKGKDIICIYVAIGQKASSVAKLVNTLEKHGALEYSIIVNAPASDPAPLQYISPYVGCALGEYFMENGRDVLIVYDDLSKHAVAYRSLSLLLERSPGREAYPGDVFYLHSRLLERSAHLSDAKGGGSMTAFPIVETQVGDVSAYIPTNIISITDGQIFLESDLFFAGQRPAVNIGISVSRVGGEAQTSAMKKATGTLRLELAQSREMEIFMQFSSDLDEATKRRLVYGQGLMRLLRQEQHSPMKLHEQVITLVAALARVMQDVPLDQIGDFNRKLLSYMQKKAPHICNNIDQTGDLTDEMKRDILNLILQFLTNNDEF